MYCVHIVFFFMNKTLEFIQNIYMIKARNKTSRYIYESWYSLLVLVRTGRHQTPILRLVTLFLNGVHKGLNSSWVEKRSWDVVDILYMDFKEIPALFKHLELARM